MNEWLASKDLSTRAHLRLFCFPYAGGGASIFRGWQASLPREVEVCPVQLPGRENRLGEPAYASLPALIDALLPALLPFLDRPYAFYGHSMGALISFELARALQKLSAYQGPAQLFLSGCRAPHLPDISRPTHELPEKEFIEELRRLSGTPEAVLENEELLHVLLPLLRADFTLCRTYKYLQGPLLTCPIIALGGLYDKDVSRESIAAWKKETSGPFTMRFFAGDHFYLIKEQAALLHVLSQYLLSQLRKE